MKDFEIGYSILQAYFENSLKQVEFFHHEGKVSMEQIHSELEIVYGKVIFLGEDHTP